LVRPVTFRRMREPSGRQPSEIARRPGVGLRWLSLALLRHPSGLGGATRGARDFISAASPQMPVTGFAASRYKETAGQITNSGHLALARLI